MEWGMLTYQISTHTYHPRGADFYWVGNAMSRSIKGGTNDSISSGGKAICLARYAQLKGADAVAS